jgi:hypothetical protein
MASHEPPWRTDREALGGGDNAALRGADVGHHRRRRHRVPGGRQELLVGEDVRREDDDIRVAHAGREVGGDPIHGARAQRSVEARAVPADPDDVARHAVGARGEGDGAAQEPDAHDGQPLDHAVGFPSTVFRAFTRRRFSCGVPTVTRRADSIPNGVMGRTITPSFSRRW